MGAFASSASLCLGNKHCLQLAKKLMSDVRSTTSTTLGAISVIVWVMAEIPQLITNYRAKSTEGLSFTFLMTWIIGDLLNVFGCLLEPATLPSQLYTAWLYTFITVSLGSQAIYYGHIYPRLKYKRQLKVQVEAPTKVGQNNCGMENAKDADHCIWFDDLDTCTAFSSPIPVPGLTENSVAGRKLYYQSARYLSKSHNPTAETLFTQGMAPTKISNSVKEPLLGSAVPAQSEPVLKIKTTLCLVSSLTLLGAFYLIHSNDRGIHSMVSKPRQEFVIHVGRKLLQVSGDQQPDHAVEGHSGIGTLFGWPMAFIYMGGRLPQIRLNIKRGHAEGVNPLMFLLAIVGNGTYFASILVRSLDWSTIRPNLPWLVESGGCALLDCFIVMQFIYFRCWTWQRVENVQTSNCLLK